VATVEGDQVERGWPSNINGNRERAFARLIIEMQMLMIEEGEGLVFVSARAA
jgi:hypothetical protein